ncbi:MAG: 4Fe-4S dicluster domain-containing protein [Planctomycetota bacterium]
MNSSRRDFLLIAGGATVISLGVGGASLLRGNPKPSSDPGPAEEQTGKHWALAIDTEKCAERCSADGGCGACISACHEAHNVPDLDDTRREIKWIWHESLETVFHDRVNEHTSKELRERPVLVLCNHCDNPPCVRVCPTGATWKREDGPVMMDMHRCIGCRYCITACPYGSRSFNFSDPRACIEKQNPDYPTRTKGVVEKCTLCTERLSRGERPACVEACEQAGVKAILFGDLNDPDSEIRKFAGSTLPARRKEGLGTLPQVYYKL